MDGIGLRQRVVMIGVACVLIVLAVWIAGRSVSLENAVVAASEPAIGASPSLPAESGVFRRAADALRVLEAPEHDANPRDLATYYRRRAYAGAPPVIPHPLLSEKDYGKGCLGCHLNGGYVPPFRAYTPVTPHPELTACTQCHVPGTENAPPAMASNTFVAARPPALDGEALPGAPPPIPHGLEMRSNCQACHAGPSSPQPIRTDHPQRVNCRQCHVTTGSQGNEEGLTWRR